MSDWIKSFFSSTLSGLASTISSAIGSPWLYAGLFAVGVVIGAGGAWKVMSWRIDEIKKEYASFVAQTEALGKQAQAEAAAKETQYKQAQKEADIEYKNNLDHLRADNVKLLQARSRSGYVPAAPRSTRRPDLACFDRAEFTTAIRRLDAGVSDLIEKGSESIVRLQNSQAWYNGVLKTQPKGR